MDDGGKAEFNSALEYLKRINDSLSLCAEASMRYDANLWVNGLSWCFRELSTQMKEDVIKVRSSELKSLLDDCSGLSKRNGMRITAGLYWRLVEFELFLRKVFKDSGLEMKYSEGAGSILFKGNH